MSRAVILLLSLCSSIAAAPGADPVADSNAIILAGRARFTVLTPQLIRMEWSAESRFEDRASFVFLNRRLPVPEFEAHRQDGQLTIKTHALTLSYDERADRPFDAGDLAVALTLDGNPVTWRPGMEDRGNLKGTYRTLDGVSGVTALPPGLLSRDGWVLVDDSRRHLFDAVEGSREPWITPRTSNDTIDWYFFGYGHAYTQALHDFTRVAGRIPLPPRFAFGTWWSRYWAYSERELRELVGEFHEHDVPLDVLVIDMDWHLDGWTGYTWNPEYFPDPAGFLEWVHAQGLKATLNLHPAAGVGRHERAFEQVARHMDLDPETTKRVPFDCTDPRYVEAYFKYLHHPLERTGVDFWWIDWQQGTRLPQGRLPAVDPLPWLNHLHWVDMVDNPDRAGRRPMQFSRWGKLGCHRYQVGFSGDTYNDWESLAFQPYFTATAGNVAYPFWSHDIGGHMPGPVEPELYARWVQWGVFSPILRTHTTKNPLAERRIWEFPPAHYRAMKAAFELRYALIPYIYTAARQAYDSGLPICRPMYYAWPDQPAAYTHPNQYQFGDDLLVAPVVQPADSLTGWSAVDIWIPPGEWTAWFTGIRYKGPSTVSLLVPLDEIPVFSRRGAVVAMQPPMRHTGEKPVDPLILNVWPGASSTTRVYEDDGTSDGYTSGEYSRIPVTHEHIDDRQLRVRIGPVEGTYPGMLEQRRFEVRVHDDRLPSEVLLHGSPVPQSDEVSADQAGWRHDQDARMLVIVLPPQDVRSATEVSVQLQPAGRYEAAGRLGHKWRRILTADAAPGRAMVRRVAAAALTPESFGPFFDTLEDPVFKRRLLARMCGLSADLQAAVGTPQPLALELVARIGASPMVQSDRITCRVTLSATPNWETSAAPQPEFDLSTNGRQTIDMSLTPRGEPQTGTGRLDLTFESMGVEVTSSLQTLLLPSINRWWIAGPIPKDYETACRTAFEPEENPDPTSSFRVAGRTFGWTRVERPLQAESDLTAEFRVELDAVFGSPNDHALAYALTYLRAPRELDAVLALGSDDGVAVWLNGEPVHAHTAPRAYTSREDRVPIRLRAGSNTLLLKIIEQAGDWRFAAHVETEDGQPLTEVTAHLAP